MGRFTILIFLSFLFIGGCKYVVEPSSNIDIIYPIPHNPAGPYGYSYGHNVELVYVPRLLKPPRLKPPRIYYYPMIFTAPSAPIIKQRPYYNKPIPRRYSSVSRQRDASRSVRVRSRKSIECDSNRRHDLKSNTSSIGDKKRRENRTKIRSRVRRSK